MSMLDATRFDSYRLISMPSANCHVVFGINDFASVVSVELVSYKTPILRLTVPMGKTDGTLEILYSVNCSNTTARHVNRFTGELFAKNLYYECKKSGAGTEMIVHDVLSRLVEMHHHYCNVGKKYYG